MLSYFSLERSDKRFAAGGHGGHDPESRGDCARVARDGSRCCRGERSIGNYLRGRLWHGAYVFTIHLFVIEMVNLAVN